MSVSSSLLRWMAVFFALSSIGASAIAAPPKAGAQAPGYFRATVGDLEVTALYDGYANIRNSVFKNIDEAAVHALVTQRHLDDANGVQTAINAYLIHTGDRLILVDAGSAACFGPGAGHILDALRASGYSPADVDAVLITHMHPDHICGLIDASGKPVYPKAVVWAAAADAGFWLAPDKTVGMFKMAQNAVAPYLVAKTFRTFEPGSEIMPGVVTVATPGHTPGHTAYRFSSQGRQLLIWGDIVHGVAVQFAHPDVAYQYDTDQKTAVASRRKAFALAADTDALVGGAHLPFPGLGYVRRLGADAYAWTPMEYAPLP